MAILDKEVIRARLAARIEPDPVTGCHVFTGCWRKDGRGRMRVGSKVYDLRRVVAWLDGRIELWEPCYPYRTCKTPACVNPKHVAVAPNFGAGLIQMRKRKVFTLIGRIYMTPVRLSGVRIRLREGDTLKQIAADLDIRPDRLARALKRRNRKDGHRGNAARRGT